MRKARAGVAVDVPPSLAALAAPDCPQPDQAPLFPVASPAVHGLSADTEPVHGARPDGPRAAHGLNGLVGAEDRRMGKDAGGMGFRGSEEEEGGAGDEDARREAVDPPPALSSRSPGSGRSMRHLGSSRSAAMSRGASMAEGDDDDGDDGDDGDDDGLLSVRRGGATPRLSLWEDDDSRLDTSRSDATGSSSGRSSGGAVSGGRPAPRKHTGVGPALQQRVLPPSMSMSRARMRLAGMKLDLGVLPMGPAGVLLPDQPAALHLSAHGADGFSGMGDGAGFGGEGAGGEEEEEEGEGEGSEAMEVRDRKEKFVFFERQCSRVMLHLYVGSDAVARDRDILRQAGITHVVNCVGFVCPEYFPRDITYKTLWLQDNTSEDIQCVLYDVFDFVNEVNRVNGRCFVHCCQGVSRSTSLVIAYLMWAQQVEFEAAFRTVKAIRGVASPNMGFACQLLQWQKRVLSPPSPTPALPPAAAPPALAAAAAADGGGIGGADSSGCNGEAAGRGARQMESVRMYRMAPHSPYDPLHLVPKMLNDVSVAALDPRGAFIVQVGASLYVWYGAACRPAMQQQAERAADQIARYERLPAPPSHIQQGHEPHGFKAALSSQRLVRGGSGEWGVCLSVLEREGLTYLGQDAHHVPAHADLRPGAAAMLPALAGGARGASGVSGKGGGKDRRVESKSGDREVDGGSENGSRRAEWVVEEREEYSFDFECFSKGLDGGTPVGAGAVSPPTKVLPYKYRGWLEASLPLNPAYALPWEASHATLPAPQAASPAAGAAAGSGVGSAVASTSSALARLTVHDGDADAGSTAEERQDEARGGEEGRVSRKPVFAPLPLHAHTSLPSPSSFSPRSLGFFPPSGSGAYGSALSKFSKPSPPRDSHRLKDQSGGSRAAGEGGAGGGSGSGRGSGRGGALRVVGGLHASGLGSNGGGTRRGLPPLTPRNTGGIRGQQSQGWGESDHGGAEEDEGAKEGAVMAVDGHLGMTEDSAQVPRGPEQQGEGGGSDVDAGVGLWMPSPRQGKPNLRAAWEEGGKDEAEEEAEGGNAYEVGVMQGKGGEGVGTVLAGLPQRRGRAARGSQSTGSEAGAMEARGKAPKPPARRTPPLAAASTASSSSSSSSSSTATPNLNAALPPAPRSSSHLIGRREVGSGGESWGEWGEGGVDEAESSGMDAFGVPLTPRRRLPPRSAFGRGFRGTWEEGAGERRVDNGESAEDGGVRSKRKGVARKEKDWGENDDGGGVHPIPEYGGEDGMGGEAMDAMQVEDAMGAGMALPTPRRLGPQIKKIF
ncbi:hypothetical protein CLOP_g11035 [Closterium sp. NIES-67]|nr:hypothetical protein CLOP_g11035 [Closterium sp. NIES-67]